MSDPFAKQLEKYGYVVLYKPGIYVLTSKGVWEVESRYYGLTLETLLEAFNEKYDCGCDKLSDRNKVILFATIASHAFSSTSSIKNSSEYESIFMELMEESYNFLSSIERISIPYEKFSGGTKATTKRPSSKIMSTVNELPGSTYSLYVSKNSTYYVSIYNNGKLDTEALKSLLSVVFGVVNVDEIAVIAETCRNISSKVCAQFNDEYDAALENTLDDTIEECLEELAFGR